MKRGLVHIYTGEGKGKTTAALGLALRASGHNLHVYMIQFLKPAHLISGEMNIKDKNITIERIGSRWWSLKSFKKPEDVKKMRILLKKKMDELKEIVLSEKYDLIIIDEINNCLKKGLIDLENVIELIEKKPYSTELILTGRDAHNRLIEKADLVTEMRCIKHPYNSFVKARKGIEY